MMLKRNIFLWIVFVGFAMAMAAQTAVTSLPYFCGFEEDAENQNWTLNQRVGLALFQDLPSKWVINAGAKHSGMNGLYIALKDDEEVAEYDGSAMVFATAERLFNVPAGTYTLAFDWRCLGDAENDAIYVYWVPATDAITSRNNSSLPTGLTPLTINTKNYLSGSPSWKQVVTTVNVISGQYKLVIAWRNNNVATYNPGACIDNVQLHQQEQATDCWHTVKNLKWTQGQTVDVLSWQPAVNAAGVTYDLYYWLDGDSHIDSVMGITATSYQFSHGDLHSGLYTFAIRTNCGDEQSIQLELAGCKSKGDFSSIAEACPEVTLHEHHVANGEKYLRPSCDESGQFMIKPSLVAGGGSIAGYRVDQIDYSDCPFPFDLAAAQQMMGAGNYLRQIRTDDVWDSQILTLPFKVCFFEGTYAQAVVCSNGLVSFDTQVAGKAAGYSLSQQPNIPSPQFGGSQGTGNFWRNAIYGVFQDYDPAYGGEIWYGVLGEWPCRKMVVCWNKVPMYQNHNVINSSMIVMYEGTNVIDVYVKNRDLSTGWNDNRGIIGLQNAAGTDGVAAPGRNTTDGDSNHRSWSAKNEAWRFTPYSTPTYALTWYKGSFATPEAIDQFVGAHPNMNIKLSMADSIGVTKDDGIDAVTVRMQYSQCNGDFIDIIDHAVIQWAHTDTLVVDTFMCAGRAYSDRYVNRADTSGTYEVIIPNSWGCDSIIYTLKLRTLPVDTSSMDTTICEGQVLEYQGLRLTKAGKWPIKKQYAGCNCDSVVEYVNLSVVDKLHGGIADFPEQICGDDSLFSFLLDASIPGVHYDVRFEPAGSGFENIYDAEIDQITDVIVRAKRQVRPGVYTMYVNIADNGCGSVEDSITFTVSYPASIAPQKWGNVLVLLDTDFNGGYTFSHIQWYRNGEPIFGANGPYYYAGEGETLDDYAVYTIGLIRDGETYEIQSCPLGDHAATTGLEDVQGLDPNVLPQALDGHMAIFDALGRELANEAYDYERLLSIVRRAQQGLYLVNVTSLDGHQTYRLYNNK